MGVLRAIIPVVSDGDLRVIGTEDARPLLDPGAAVDLAHALVQRAADLVGVRALFIKGPIANHHRLRESRVPSDVDVLVHPEDVETLTMRLTEWGWSPRPESFAHRSFVTHSTTLMHPDWPCDIDVHRAFPGFLADDGVAFDHAWNRRETIRIAAVPVTGVDFAASTAIAALHALRAPYILRNRDEYDTAIEAVRARDDVAEQTASIVEFARDVGALPTLAPFLRDLGVEVAIRPEISAKYVEWHRNSRQLNRAAGWLMIITTSPWPRRAAYIWRAVFPGVDDLLLDHPSTPRSLSGVARTWLGRAVQAVRAMPEAMDVVREERRLLRRGRDRARAPVVTDSAHHRAVARTIAAPPPAGVSQRSSAVSPREEPAPEVVPAGRAVRDLTRVSRADLVAEAVSQDTAVVLPLAHPSQPKPYVIGGTGLALWRMTEHSSALAQIVASAAVHYDVEEDVLRRDVEAFLVRLVELDVLVAR